MTDQTKHEPRPDHRELADIKARLERLLFENIVPAWYPGSIDRLWGGYRLDRDVSGNWLPRSGKMIVTQARMTWFFARLARFVPDGSAYLMAAKGGVRFLRSRLRDRVHGGYNIEVSPWGLRTTNANKNLYCQTITLMALSEYARASGDEGALSSSVDLFRTIEDRSYDPMFPGYRESFLTDWELQAGLKSGFLGPPSDTKTLNTHMHLIEAYTTYLSVRVDELAATRILEVLDLMRAIVNRAIHGALCDVYKTDWSPHPDAKFNRVSYGHNIELIWLFVDACDSIKQSTTSDIPWFETVFDYAIQFGFDENLGGFYMSGPFGEKADNLDKIWWVQAEALISALTMYRLTEKPKYWACFLKTLSWIENFQADWEGGDWHSCVTIEGAPRGPKAERWKAAYHNGRAMMECLERLPAPLSK